MANHSHVDKFVNHVYRLAREHQAGFRDLHDAVDGCQNYAEAFGIIEAIGQDSVQHILATAFKSVRSEFQTKPAPAEGVAQSTFDAVAWVLRTYGAPGEKGDNEWWKTRIINFSDAQLRELIAHLQHHNATAELIDALQGMLS